MRYALYKRPYADNETFYRDKYGYTHNFQGVLFQYYPCSEDINQWKIFKFPVNHLAIEEWRSWNSWNMNCRAIHAALLGSRAYWIGTSLIKLEKHIIETELVNWL